MKSAAWPAVAGGLFLFLGFMPPESTRGPDKDRQAIAAIEREWLDAQDAATLDRILAYDFAHVIPVDHFLSKREPIDWVLHHPERRAGHRKFDKLEVPLLGDAAIVNGSVVATGNAEKKERRTGRCSPTFSCFARDDGRR